MRVLGIGREGGRGNGSFPDAEVLEPLGSRERASRRATFDSKYAHKRKSPDGAFSFVRPGGIEPPTSSMSMKRSTTELRTQCTQRKENFNVNEALPTDLIAQNKNHDSA
jgi:hypothetical protein